MEDDDYEGGQENLIADFKRMKCKGMNHVIYFCLNKDGSEH